MTPELLRERTKKFGVDVIRWLRTISTDDATRVVSRQLIRSATSVGANYRAACRAKSKADMINKLKVVEEEADESVHWIEVLLEACEVPISPASELRQEATELTKIVTASIMTLKFGKLPQ